MSYITFDEFGITEIRCMCCDTPVASRTYMELFSRIDPSKKEKVMAMSRFSNWRQIKVNLSDGTYCNPIVCSDCEKDEEEYDWSQLSDQMKKGWESEMKFAGYSKETIKEHKVRVKKLSIKAP